MVRIQKSRNKRMSGQDYDALAEMGGCTASAGGMPAVDRHELSSRLTSAVARSVFPVCGRSCHLLSDMPAAASLALRTVNLVRTLPLEAMNDVRLQSVFFKPTAFTWKEQQCL